LAARAGRERLKKLFLRKFGNMKKILGLCLLAALMACDDGDTKVESIDFSEVQASACGNIVYKIRANEALFFEVGSAESAFPNDQTPDGNPIVLPVDDSNRIFYRSYNGTVSDDNLCETVQPATPIVTEQWTATDGSIEITSAAVKIANPNPEFAGGEQIVKYRHTVIFRNITLQTPGGTQIQEALPFGDYFTYPISLPFNFDQQLDKCGDLIYDLNGSEALTLDINPDMIVNEITPTGQPRTELLGSSINRLDYRYFNGLIEDGYFCDGTTPATPTVSEQWTGQDGVSGVSGIIEVTTTSSGPGVFQHEIHLKNVVLTRGNTSFKLADDYLFGILITS
jgi:hypothetical protein